MPSSVIYGMAYSPRARTLDVTFQGAQGTYRYYDVTPNEWNAFKDAPSKGTHLNAVFKEHHPHYAKLKSSVDAGVTQLPNGHETARRQMPNGNVWGFHDELPGVPPG